MPRKRREGAKYGAPLYCATWPPGEYVLVAGGGGKSSSGIKNKIVVAKRQGATLGEAVDSVPVDDAPLRMAVNPQGTAVLLVVGSGSLRRFDLQLLPKQQPQLTSVAVAATPLALEGCSVKCLEFSTDGRLLGLGTEDGQLVVLHWPSLATGMHLRGDDALRDGVRDVDFSPGHSNKVMASTCEDGTCTLWDWQSGERIKDLAVPQGLERGSFSRCRFARDGTRELFTTMNMAGDGFLVAYTQSESGVLSFSRKAKAHSGAITAFDISVSGEFLGTGTSDGDIAIHHSSKLTPLLRVRESHMVFVTALTFAPDNSALLSVSADASAQVLPVKVASNPFAVTPLMVVFALVFLLLAVLVGRYQYM